MVRCYICSGQCAGDDEAFVCEHCGTRCHRRCMAKYGADVCPRCVDEPMIGAHEL